MLTILLLFYIFYTYALYVLSLFTRLIYVVMRGCKMDREKNNSLR